MSTAATLPVLLVSTEHYRSLPPNEQYAHFCALGYPDEYDARYAAGLKDFPKLVHVEGVTNIGIAWDVVELIVGTKEVIVEDDDGEFRILGRYILYFTMSGYRIENVDLVLDKSYGHPHARQNGEFCMTTGHSDVKTRIKDGIYSTPAQILMTALMMQKGTVEIAAPYQSAKLENWPRRK